MRKNLVGPMESLQDLEDLLHNIQQTEAAVAERGKREQEEEENQLCHCPSRDRSSAQLSARLQRARSRMAVPRLFPFTSSRTDGDLWRTVMEKVG